MNGNDDQLQDDQLQDDPRDDRTQRIINAVATRQSRFYELADGLKVKVKRSVLNRLLRSGFCDGLEPDDVNESDKVTLSLSTALLQFDPKNFIDVHTAEPDSGSCLTFYFEGDGDAEEDEEEENS